MTAELQKGIDSFRKRIAEHLDKISNPGKYIEEWRMLDKRQQEALINKKWPSEINEFKEQQEILEKILQKCYIDSV